MKRFGWTKVNGSPLSMTMRSVAPCWRPKVNEAAGWAPIAENFTRCRTPARRARSTNHASLHQALIDGREQQAPLDAGERGVEDLDLVEVRADELGARPLEVSGPGWILGAAPGPPCRTGGRSCTFGPTAVYEPPGPR